MTTEQLQQIAVAQLKANPLNPRHDLDAGAAELAASIGEVGVLEPLIVTPNGQQGTYYIVAGHRRWAAARRAGLETVPCLVRAMDQRQQQLCIIVENLQRQDLSPVEEARAYRQLQDLGLSQADIARQVGCNHARIHHRLAILRLDPQVQQLIDRGELPVTVASVLIKVADGPTQRRLAALSAKRRMTPAQLSELVRRNQGDLAVERPRPKAEPVRVEPTTGASGRPSRKEAVAALRNRAGQTIMLATVAAALDPVCGMCADCGMDGIEEICRECPLPLLAMRLAHAS